MDIGFAAKTTLEKVYKEKKISQLQVLESEKNVSLCKQKQ